MLENLSARNKVHAAEAHWKGGIAERHGGILKITARKLIKEFTAMGREEMSMVLSEALQAKNSLARKAGFNPKD